jgi:hypothetical protein
MDKTSGPLGAATTNVAIAANGSAYIYASPSITMDSPGTCVFTAMARTTTSISSSFFVYPSLEVSGSTTMLCSSPTSGANFCAGTFAYGSAAFGGTVSYSTPSVSGSFDVSSGVAYRFGCFISIGTAATYTCAVSWVCN